MVAGDLGAYKRKHTGNADLDAFQTIKTYLSNAKAIYDGLIRDKEHLKTINLSATRMAELMGKMFIEKEIITSTQINIMKREMYNPTYYYGVPGNNAWALYNYATHAFKEDSPRSWIKRHVDLHEFFNEEFKTPSGENPVQIELFTEPVAEQPPVVIPQPKQESSDATDIFDMF